MEHISKRVINIDIMRIIATLAVINIHVISNFNKEPLNSVSSYWWYFGDISHSLSRFAVPLFIMISGALLLNSKKEENTKDFLKKRLLKVVIPFLFWSVAYILFNAHLAHNYKNINVVYILKTILAGPVYFHLWFVYAIIPLYLITPIIKKGVNNLNNSQFKYLFLLWGLTTFHTYIGYFFKINVGIYINNISGFIGYFISGYYIYKSDISRKQRKIWYLIGVISLMFTIIETRLLSIQNGVFNQFFYDSMQPNIILITVAVFIFLKYHKFKNIHGRDMITKLSNVCFPVYLMHPLVLHYLSKLKINVNMVNPLVGDVSTVCLTMIICFLIILPLQRIPYINSIIIGHGPKTIFKRNNDKITPQI